VLHLSEHHGDGSPGVHIRIKVNDVRAFHAEITGKAYNFLRPRIERQEWGEDSVNLTDPFGNRLTFSSLARNSIGADLPNVLLKSCQRSTRSTDSRAAGPTWGTREVEPGVCAPALRRERSTRKLLMWSTKFQSALLVERSQ
jgi:hypothetical protein